MLKRFVCIILFYVIGINTIYSQTADLYDFFNSYFTSKGLNNSDAINFVLQNSYLPSFFDGAKNYINNINPNDWTKVLNDPSLISLYTENEDVVLMMAGAEYLYDTYMFNLGVSSLVMDKLKRKAFFNAASGDNYGLVIPLHFPLGTVGVGTYVNMSYDTFTKNIKDNNNFVNIVNAIDRVALPYVQLFASINAWTAPISIGLRFSFLPGYSDLFSPFIKDTYVEALGVHGGLDIKFYIYRNKYIFLDARTDFNFDYGTLNLSYKNSASYQEYDADHSINTGAFITSDASLRNKWTSFAVTPKIVFGFKPKDRVPYIDYLAVYGFVGVDFVYSSLDVGGQFSVNTIKSSFPNSAEHDFYMDIPSFGLKDSYFYYDIRFGLTIDIFYQSISVEYALYSKSFSFNFVPFVYRFGEEPKT